MRRLIEYLPEFYAGSPYVTELQGAFTGRASAVEAAKNDLFAQFVLETATWGLPIWEQAYGLEADVTKPLPYRRSRVRSKMRSAATTTPAMIRNVAESFSNGQVEVIEYPGEYRFEVKFVGTMGVPPNMKDLSAALDDLRPAHLAYDYVILYRIHSLLKQYRHDELAGYTHETIKGGEIDGGNRNSKLRLSTAGRK